jgi:Predicted membrane protein
MTTNGSDTGKLLLRLACGGLLLPHGLFKVFVEIDSIKAMVSAAGLPAFLAYGTLVGEILAPVLLIIGWKTRIAALVISFNMLMSILVAHRDIAFKVNDYWGWMIELNVFFLMTALSVFFIGPGSYSLSRGRGRWH